MTTRSVRFGNVEDKVYEDEQLTMSNAKIRSSEGASRYEKLAQDDLTTSLAAPDPEDVAGVMHKLLTKLQSESLMDVAKALIGIIALLNKGDGVDASDACALQATSNLFSCMAQWQDNEQIQALALLSLLGFVAQKEVARLDILKEEAVQAIVIAMKLFPSNRDIQRVGCLVLEATFRGMSTHSDVANNVASNLVMEWEGVDIVLDTMKRFSDDAAIQGPAIQLLRSLWNVECAQSRMMDKGAERLIAGALSKFPRDKAIKEQAMRFLDVIWQSTRVISVTKR